MNKRLNAQRSRLRVAIAAAVVTGGVVGMQPTNVWAYTSEDGTAEVHGFVENASFRRQGVGLSKFRNTVQIEGDKSFGDIGIFKNVTFHGEFRGTYDGVYDLNDDEFGDKAGGAINLQNTATNGFVPHGGGIVLPGGDFNSTNPNAANFNPNDGLVVLGNRTHGPGGGVTFGVPVRPCDKDNRGCIGDYLDYDSGDLRNPEFNERLDFLREAYVDFSMPINDFEEWSFRVGRQQVVWGRTDLFRVLDVLNPVDFSRNNIYDELEDIRYPMWMATAEYRMGPKLGFEDLNLQFVWNFDKFRPHNLGQGGTPNSILDAGSFFRGLKNCWDNGCTVSNFANGTLATDFPAHVIGIRQANLPEWSLQNSQVGIKLEGVYDGIGFSLNALHYRSQLPSLRGGIPADDPFTPAVESRPFDHLIAFDIDFPRVTLYGGSLDFYVDPLKSVVRAEVAYTQGEEFANTIRPRLFSESDVVRWVVGIDRNTFIPFLNKNRAFLISGQIFGQHLLDHELEQRLNGPAGIAEWEDNYIATLLVKGFYKNDRVSPQIIFAHDFRAAATAIAPSVDWLISNSLRLTVGANFKVGAGVKQFDDCRSCAPFDALNDPRGDDTSSQGLGGFEPLGRFRSGPIGMSRAEDEIQMVLRYRF